MKESRKNAVVRCADARRLAQEQLDGPLPLEDAAFRALSRHLVRCAECRQFQRGVARAVRALRALPVLKLDARSLERVWDRTIRSARPRPQSRRRASVTWALPAAAAVFLVVAGSLALWRHGASAAAQSEEARATADLRIALHVAEKALHRGQAATLDAVLRSDLVPALDRVPVLNLLSSKFSERRT